MELDMATNLIVAEYRKATRMFPKFNNQHEGYTVIKEELDELWDDIKKNKNAKKEAIQVGAMALRFLIDLTQEEHAKGCGCGYCET